MNLNFSDWLIMESVKKLARLYRGMLEPIPQDPTHHPEGNVLKHVKLVRASIDKAISYLNGLKNKEPWKTILQNISIDLNPQEIQIIKLATWLHDIGKVPTTTVKTDDGERHWSVPGPEGKIRSLKHEEPEYYEPEIERLKSEAPEELTNLYTNNKSLFDFLIQRHMDVSKGGFPKWFVADYFDNGVMKPDAGSKIKLLLVLIYADKMGREPFSQSSIDKNDQALIAASEKSKISAAKVAKKADFETPESMVQSLKVKNLSPNKIMQVIRDKFKLSDDEIQKIMQA